MIRHILLNTPIHYKLMNGSEMNFDCLSIEYLKNKPTQVKLSVLGGCATHNEIRISANVDILPQDYVAVRMMSKSSPVIIPELVKRGVLKEHPDKKIITHSFIEYPLYEICTPIAQVSQANKYLSEMV